jgi:hypothetical protein
MDKFNAISLFLLCILISSCKHNINFSPNGRFLTPGDINPVKGNVTSLMEKNFVSISMDNKDSVYLNDTDSICFDENGNMIYEMVRISGTTSNERIYKYDEQGVHVFSKLFEKDSLRGTLNIISKKTGPDQFETVSYKDGVVSGKTIYSCDKHLYVTDKKEFIINNGEEILKLHQKQENDEAGQIIRASFYDLSGKPFAQYFYSYSKYYGPDSIKILKGNAISKHIYRYDQYGNPLTKMIDGDTIEQYSYECDNLGNWIKKNNYEQGRMIDYQIRKYYYK